MDVRKLFESPTVDINHVARIVDEAAAKAEAIPQLSLEHPLNVEEAYAVQAASIQRRLDRGESRTGVKMGFTSKAKMIQMGVDDLIWGRLTDQMVIDDGGEVDYGSLIHPRVEPEIAFLLNQDLPCRVTMSLIHAMKTSSFLFPMLWRIIPQRVDMCWVVGKVWISTFPIWG